jgi:hypothetical protein
MKSIFAQAEAPSISVNALQSGPVLAKPRPRLTFVKTPVRELPKNGHAEPLVSDVRVAPRVLENLSAWVRDHQALNSKSSNSKTTDREAANIEMAGLLFGTVAEGVVSVEALTRVSFPKPVDDRAGMGERLEKAFDESMSESKLPREVASLGLIGWWCVRPAQKIRRLRKELEFHNQRFRRSTDVFAVVTLREARHASARLFARSRHSPISIRNHRSTWLDLPFSPSGRLLLIPAGAPHPDLCLVSYRAPNGSPPAAEYRKQSAGSLVPAFLKRVPAPAALPEAAKKANRIPLLIPAAFLLSALAVFVALVHFSGSPKPAERHVIAAPPSNVAFRMRVESQKNGVLIGWNDQLPALRSATKGVLQVEDGSQTHTTQLASSDLAKGSILLKPNAPDVNFRLTIYKNDGSTLTDHVRFIDRSKQPALADAAGSSNTKSPASSAAPAGAVALPSDFADGISLPTAPPKAVQMSSEAPVVAPGVDPEAKPIDLATPQPAAYEPKPAPAESTPAPQSAAPQALPPQVAPPQTHPAPAATNRAVVAPAVVPSYVPPKPLRTVKPSLEAFPPSQLAGIAVIDVEVDIDTSGHVTAARAVDKGRNVSWLVTAAVIAAAKKWTFEPAKMNGRIVPAKHTIAFHVAGSQD